MTGWREPKEPAAIPKSIRLRERANSLKAQADELLRKADTLLAEAERLEANATQKKRGVQPSVTRTRNPITSG